MLTTTGRSSLHGRFRIVTGYACVADKQGAYAALSGAGIFDVRMLTAHQTIKRRAIGKLKLERPTK